MKVSAAESKILWQGSDPISADQVVAERDANSRRSSGKIRHRESRNLVDGLFKMLARPAPGRYRAAAGLFVVATLVSSGSDFAWSAQPSSTVAAAAAESSAVTPAPPGLLTALEARVHPLFVKAAQRGDIRIVFIGDSIADFWRYDWGGKKAWDADFLPRKAANFGVEGAHTKSVLWRLQHGELDGYRAQVVVLPVLGVADYANHGAALPDIVAGEAAVIAEVRKRQPQAKILLVAVPRGYPEQAETFLKTLERLVSKLADNRSMIFLDLRDRFAGVDGIFVRGHGAGLSPDGYALWAKAMRPTLDDLMK